MEQAWGALKGRTDKHQEDKLKGSGVGNAEAAARSVSLGVVHLTRSYIVAVLICGGVTLLLCSSEEELHCCCPQLPAVLGWRGVTLLLSSSDGCAHLMRSYIVAVHTVWDWCSRTRMLISIVIAATAHGLCGQLIYTDSALSTWTSVLIWA